jgi:hypothetical protein
MTWILHESEAFICKALKGEATVNYASTLTRPPRLSGSRWRAGNAADGSLRLARRVKINEKKWFSPTRPDRQFGLAADIFTRFH